MRVYYIAKGATKESLKASIISRDVVVAAVELIGVGKNDDEN